VAAAVVLTKYIAAVKVIGDLVTVYAEMVIQCVLKVVEVVELERDMRVKVDIANVLFLIRYQDAHWYMKVSALVDGEMLQCQRCALWFQVFIIKECLLTIIMGIYVVQVLLNFHVYNVIALLQKHVGAVNSVKTAKDIDNFQVLAVWVLMLWVVVQLGVEILDVQVRYTYDGVVYNMSINNKEIVSRGY
tara:strand:- start:1728 stop:2294 length:567 start_codon:yes stop_codon:yes gene_type:complete